MCSQVRDLARVETRILRGTALALPSAMSRGLKKKIRGATNSSDFADRLHEIAARIERDFDGRERDRLLELVHESLERHVEIRANTQKAREALEKLQSDQRALLWLFDFITARPESTTVH
jgi:hypothetical protein